MDFDEAKSYFTGLAKLSGMGDEGLDRHINLSIQVGVRTFWNCHPWKFRVKTASLDVSGSSPYSLPSDFSSMLTIRETSSLTGYNIRLINRVDFDRHFPNPSATASGTPRIGSIYKDDDSWKIIFMPNPNISTLYLTYFRSGTPNIDAIPDDYESGVLAYIEKFLYPIGSKERLQAWKFANDEVSRLINSNHPVHGIGSKFLDDVDTRIGAHIPWMPPES